MNVYVLQTFLLFVGVRGYTVWQQLEEENLESSLDYRSEPYLDPNKQDIECDEFLSIPAGKRVQIKFKPSRSYGIGFNTDQLKWSEFRGPGGWVGYYGWTSEVGMHPSNVVPKCNQLWIELDDIEGFTSYECCVSKGYRVLLKPGPGINEATLEGYQWSRCLDSTSCKPLPSCRRCKNIGSPHNFLYLSTAPSRGSYSICGGTGMEQLGCNPYLNVTLKTTGKIGVWVKVLDV